MVIQEGHVAMMMKLVVKAEKEDAENQVRYKLIFYQESVQPVKDRQQRI